MKWGFNGAADRDNTTVTTIDALRDQVTKRLEASYKKLDAKGVSASFSRSARAGGDAVGDMGLIGSLIAGSLFWGSFLQGLEATVEQQIGETSAFDTMNDPFLCAVLDGASLVWDDKANNNRSRKMSGYPQGRRKAYQGDAVINKKFNLVAANQNTRHSYDTQAEIACMFELLDILARLEDQGVQMIRLPNKSPVYDELKSVNKGLFQAGAVMTYAMPMRKMA